LAGAVPVVFGAIFLLLYMLFGSVPETLALILPCVYALTGGLVLQYAMGFNFSVAVMSAAIASSGSTKPMTSASGISVRMRACNRPR